MQSAKTQPIDPDHHISWVKPPGGTIKCNMDAAIFQNNAVAGYGICYRNSEGELLLGKSAIIHSSLSVLEAEAIALLEAMKLSISSRFHHVYYETDSKILTKAILSNTIHHNEFGDLVAQCRNLLITNSGFKVSFIRRQANRVAHSIARASLTHPSPYIFN